MSEAATTEVMEVEVLARSSPKRMKVSRDKADPWRKCYHGCHMGHIYCSVCRSQIKFKVEEREQQTISAATVNSVADAEVYDG